MARRLHRSRTTVHRMATAMTLALLLLLCALPMFAIAEEGDLDMQGTLEGADTGGAPPGAGHEWTAVWPRHPTDAEIEAAKDAFKMSVWTADGSGGWTEQPYVTFDSKKTFKSHTIEGGFEKGKVGLSGDPDTGDAVFMEWSGTANYDALSSGWNSSPIPEDPGAPQAPSTGPVSNISMLIFDVTDQEFRFDIVAAGVNSLDGVYETYGYADGWVTEGSVGDTGSRAPWKTVTGGAAALAAAATALAGAAAKSSAKSGRKQDPNRPVGFILHLSTRQLQLAPNQAMPFEATAYKVMPDGRAIPAEEATVTLRPPAGIAVQQPGGPGTVKTQVWQTGEAAPGAQLGVEAAGPFGGTSAAVQIVTEGETKLVVTFEPEEKRELVASGKDSVTLVAKLMLSPFDLQDPHVNATAAQQGIEFSSASEWLDMSAPAAWPGDARAVRVQASQPDPMHPVQPPESASVVVKAQVGQRMLSQTVAIALARNPVIDAAPDNVSLSAESGETADVRVWIDHGAGADWTFTHAWRDGSKPVAAVELEKTGPTMCSLRLAEDSAGKLDPARPEEAHTLRILANADGYEELERYIKVIMTQEGLFVDRTGKHPEDGAFRVAADGSGKTTDVDMRVYVRNPASGKIAADLSLAQSVEFSPGGETGTPGRAILERGGVDWVHAGVRQLNVPAAIAQFSCPKRLPTAGKVLHASVQATVPGQEGDKFSALIPLGLLGVDTEPFSAEWQVELERCRYVIDEYVPEEYRPKLHALLNERARTFGAEGLFEMRKKLWGFAHDQLVKEAHDHLDEAWWYQQIEDVLDWVSWCGDIAMGVASGSFVGTVGAVAIGLLKPVLVSAVTAWVYGKSIDEWAWEQLGILKNVVEGAATDPDLLAHLTGDRKALAWAIFIAYYFVKELANDPEMSVVNAMTNVGRQLRDEGLIIFLRRVAGVKPGFAGDDARAKGPKGAGATPDGGPAGTRAPKGKAPDAAPAGTKPKPDAPDAPPAKPKPEGEAPDATKPKPEPDAPDAPPAKPKPEGDTTPESGPTKPKPEGESDAPGKKPDAESPDAGKKKGEGDAPEKQPDGEKKGDADKPDGEKPADKKPDNPSAKGDPTTRADNMASDIKSKTAGGKKLDKATVEQILRDPDAMRELRKNHPDVWKDFHETRKTIYEAHDTRLKEWIRKNVPEAEGKDIEVESFGTPDGVDRDYRAGYTVTDPATGQKRFIEIKKEKWAGESQKIFAEETGGPTDPKGAADWSKKHQQLATDAKHAEASVDMADQATVWNPEGGPKGPDGKPTGAWEKTQVEPNVDMVKKGQSTLLDPDGMGKTYETKVAEAYHEGNHLDAYKQADKAVHSLEGCREGYAKQGYGVKDVPPKIDAGMQAIKDVQSGKLKPAQAEARLKELGYSGGLPDFMEKVSGQFAAFKWARKG